MTRKFTESVVEEAAIQFFEDLGYAYLPGPDIANDGLFAERAGYDDVVLSQRLRDTLVRINSHLPADAIDEAVRKVTRTDTPSVIINNQNFHRMVTDGIPVKIRNTEGRRVALQSLSDFSAVSVCHTSPVIYAAA